MLLSFFSGKKLTVLLHIVVWMVLFILPTYMIFGSSTRDSDFMTEVWFQFVCYMVIFYFSYSLLAPRLFFAGKKIKFFISIFLLIILLTAFTALLHNHFMPDFQRRDSVQRVQKNFEQGIVRPEPPISPRRDKPPVPFRSWPLFNFFLSSCMVTGLSLGLRFSEKHNLNEKMRKEAEKEKLHTELAFLKHKINPHFLFNTLNSIYSLALVKSDLTAEAVMKLSDMMRYVIQDVEHEKVPLELELEYVIHYVELQKIRLSDNVDVRIQVDGDPMPYEIPPMILVPFIENAFKYGTSSHDKAAISINMKIKEGLLSYLITNQIFGGRENTETFGIGIRNTRQRLNLMYPGRHKLELRNDGKTFMVNLEISLA